MSRAEIRRQRERLQRAVTWVQKRLGTPYILHLHPNPDVSKLMLSRTERGREDSFSFLLEFNAEAVAKTPRRELRSDALHETLHCIAWDAWEIAFENRPRRDWPKIKESLENAFYRVERAVAPWVL